jgi:ribA/ribD-fused uncharacterized protein
MIASGWGSQWYHSPFTAKVVFAEGGEEEEVTFPTAEHWMMVQKALLFKDEAVAREIVGITDVTPSSLAGVKTLGRKVSDFEEERWVSERGRIVLEGSLHKFQQNPALKAKLLATGAKTIVEASPRDRIWGIGFGEKNALAQKIKSDKGWGLNLLGQALETTRSTLLAWEKQPSH